MTETLDLDVNDLTIGEMEKVEELSGRPFDDLSKDNAPKAKILRALVTVIKQRTDPSFTWEQAGQISINLLASDVNPTDAAG